MPYLETPPELADAIANMCGIYGAHDDDVCTEARPCRCCFATAMAERIRDAEQTPGD